MAWLHVCPNTQTRFDAAVVNSINAYHRSGAAAQGVTGAAREARHDVEAAGKTIRERSDIERNKPLRTGDVRSLVEDMLQSLDQTKDNKDHGS